VEFDCPKALKISNFDFSAKPKWILIELEGILLGRKVELSLLMAGRMY